MNAADAIRIAMEAVKNHFSGDGYRPEEVQLNEQGGFEITVSFHSPDPGEALSYSVGHTEKHAEKSIFGQAPSLLDSGTLTRRTVIGVDASRTYKDVSISSDGQVKAIRMRKIFLD